MKKTKTDLVKEFEAILKEKNDEIISLKNVIEGFSRRYYQSQEKLDNIMKIARKE